MNVFDRLIELIDNAEKSARMENTSFGFPDDRIEIKSVHFGDDQKGRVGDVKHPDDYVKPLVSLHHHTWIIAPLQEARQLLQLHADIIRDTENLAVLIGDPSFRSVLQTAEKLSEKAKAGQR